MQARPAAKLAPPRPRKPNEKAAFCLGLALLAPAVFAADSGDGLRQFLATRQARDAEIARSIWEWAEVGYQETKSSALLQQELTSAGFKVEAGVAGIPTAFVASAGSGKPVIGILAEYDALPGINQDAVADRKPIEGKQSGHACGHNLFGTASVSAAIALADWLKKSGTPGTIRVYGTPAEEGGSGKVYMVRAGLFNDVDAVHALAPLGRELRAASTVRSPTSPRSSASTASRRTPRARPRRAAPRSTAVEAMDNMANMMREHIPSDARMHYVITSGGSAPNVVPDFAESYYYVRHIDAQRRRVHLRPPREDRRRRRARHRHDDGLRGHRRHRTTCSPTRRSRA